MREFVLHLKQATPAPVNQKDAGIIVTWTMDMNLAEN